MSAEFFDILKPPQTLDTLDAWGGLDSLPYSLDSSMWERVGVYGLLASEGGRSGEALSGDSVIRGLALSGKALSGGAMLGVKVTYLDGSAKAESSEGGTVSVVRGVGGRASAESGGSLTYLAIRALFDTEPATSGGSMLGVKVSYLSGEGLAETGGELAANFLRSLEVVAAAEAGGKGMLDRVLLVALGGQARSSESASFTFKGWNWNSEKPSTEPEWTPEMEEPGFWTQKGQGVSVWAAQSVATKDWKRRQGGAAQWQ